MGERAVPNFTRERNTELKLLVNFCIRESMSRKLVCSGAGQGWRDAVSKKM